MVLMPLATFCTFPHTPTQYIGKTGDELKSNSCGP